MNYKLLQELKEQVGKNSKEDVRKKLKDAGFVEWEGFDLKLGEVEVWSTMEEIGRYYHLTANKQEIHGSQFSIVGVDDDTNSPIIVITSFYTS